MGWIDEARAAMIVADHRQQAEYRRAIRAAAGEEAHRLEAKYRWFDRNDERFLARAPAAQPS
jgi:hypothetical protein